MFSQSNWKLQNKLQLKQQKEHLKWKWKKHSSSTSGLKENSSTARRVMIHFVCLMKGICVSMMYMRKGLTSMRNSHYSLDSSCLKTSTLWGNCCTVMLPILTACTLLSHYSEKCKSDFPQHTKKNWKKDGSLIYCFHRKKQPTAYIKLHSLNPRINLQSLYGG